MPDSNRTNPLDPITMRRQVEDLLKEPGFGEPLSVEWKEPDDRQRLRQETFDTVVNKVLGYTSVIFPIDCTAYSRACDAARAAFADAVQQCNPMEGINLSSDWGERDSVIVIAHNARAAIAQFNTMLQAPTPNPQKLKILYNRACAYLRIEMPVEAGADAKAAGTLLGAPAAAGEEEGIAFIKDGLKNIDAAIERYAVFKAREYEYLQCIKRIPNRSWE